MKKIILLSLCFAAFFSLTACGGASANTESVTTDFEETVKSTEATSSEEAVQSTEATGSEEDSQSTDTTDSEETAQSTEAAEDEKQENPEQEFVNIEIELTTGTIKIYSGDAFSLTYDGGKTAEYSVTDSTLYIPDQNAGELTLTLPGDYAFDTVTISIDQGHLYAEGPLSAEKLTLDLGEGEATLEELSVSENCAVNVKRGSAFLSGTLAGTVEVQCKEGQIQIQPSGQQTDFNYNLELSDASVQIEDENYHGTLEKTVDNSAEDTINLSCTKGEISVEFER
ncbi:MAG: DUF4097 family beta strand repeat-containing protein [Clostridiales bacterium]|nr:DUF4097 family beta strand repeat-containing protein [Clostridiales bacterium]